MNFLVLGAGSIGSRHAAILQDMGHNVVSIDKVPRAGVFTPAELADDIVQLPEQDGVLLCTPTGTHVGAYRHLPDKVHRACLDAAFFVEKPMGEGFSVSDGALQVGFCYYYDSTLREFVKNLSYERIYHLSIVAGHDLRAWHDEPYTERYHGTPGPGGVINDSLSHSLFIARWILGDVAVLSSHYGRKSGLDLQTEDVCSVHLVGENAVSCYCVVDYLRNPREFYIEAVTTGGTMRWVHDTTQVAAMYQEQMEAFVQVCAGELRYGYPDIHAGQAVDSLLQDVRDYVANDYR